MNKPTALPRPSEFQFCCGTSCDAQANMEYVKQLEAELIDLEDRNKSLLAVNLHLSDKTSELYKEGKLLRRGIEAITDEYLEVQAKCTERGMTIKARERALRIARAIARQQGDTQMSHPDHKE